MRQFANVSISPWAINPYGASTPQTPQTAQKNPYQVSTYPPQPIYRRIVLPPAPVFYHPDVEQVIEANDHVDDAGKLLCEIRR
jgi:hypothetical protein